MTEENMSQVFRLKNTEDAKNYFIKEINQNELMSRKHTKICAVLNYVEHLLILTSTVTGCVSIFAFSSFVGIPVKITSFAVGLKTCDITARIKKYNSIFKKKKKKHNKIVLLAKTTLNIIEILISRDWCISDDEFASVNNALKEYDDLEEGIKNPNNR